MTSSFLPFRNTSLYTTAASLGFILSYLNSMSSFTFFIMLHLFLGSKRETENKVDHLSVKNKRATDKERSLFISKTDARLSLTCNIMMTQR